MINYRSDIDGLRALAVLSVIAFHAFPSVVPGGFVGVDVFFVISGYLITGLILRELAQRSFSFETFYVRRVRRILPALLAVLAVCYAFGWLALLPQEFGQLGKHVAGNAVFASNFVLTSELGYFDALSETKPLLHLWSLAVEEQFYLLWPLLLFLTSGRRGRTATLILLILLGSFAASVSLSSSANMSLQSQGFYSPLSRFWELAVGAALAVSVKESSGTRRGADSMGLIGLLLILLAVFGINRGMPFPGPLALLPTVGAALLIGAGPKGLINRGLLARPCLVGIGLISYPLYLWHWPLLVFPRVLLSETPPAGVRLGALAVSVLLAFVTYRWIEKPIRYGPSGRGKAFACGVSLLLLGGVGLWTFKADGFAFRIPEPVRAIADYWYRVPKGSRADVCNDDSESISERDSIAEKCLKPDPRAGKPVLVIWGDSHAGNLAPGIYSLYGDRFQILQHTRSSCPGGVGVGVPASCARSNAFVMEKLRQLKPDVVVVFSVWNFYAEDWGAGTPIAESLKANLLELKRDGVKKILLLGPAPQWKDRLPTQLTRFWRADLAHRIPDRMSFGSIPVAAVDEALQKQFTGGEILYYSLRQQQCDANGCLTRFGPGSGDLMSPDYGHLSDGGALYVAKRLPL